MAEIKVSQLPEASQINDNDLLMIVQGGENKKITKENCQFASGDEVAVSTTEPTEESIKLWINPDESVNVYGSYISNTYGTSQAIGYSQEYANKNLVYSTTETDTGKRWIDGKTIYRKVISSGSISLSTTATYISTGVSNLGQMIDIQFMFKYNAGSTWFKLWNMNELGYNYNQNKVFISTNQSATFDDSFIIIEYTKSS